MAFFGWPYVESRGKIGEIGSYQSSTGYSGRIAIQVVVWLPGQFTADDGVGSIFIYGLAIISQCMLFPKCLPRTGGEEDD